jgi:hypothetical protein
VDNIKGDLGKIEWSDMCGIDLAQDRGLSRSLVNTVINFGMP